MEKIRIRYERRNLLRFISHLDTLRLFQRAFIRANLPIAYSEGFNPHPKISMGDPVSLGIESKEEYMDIELTEYMQGETLIELLNNQLPKDITVTGFTDKNLNKSIQSLTSSIDYLFKSEISYTDYENIKENLKLFLQENAIIIKRRRKRKGKKIEIEENIRPLINYIEEPKYIEEVLEIKANLSSGLNSHLKPELFFDSLMKYFNIDYDPDALEIVKDCIYNIENTKGLL